MLSLGLSYPSLTILQDAGLIQTDLNAWRMFQIPELLEMPFKLGPTSYTLKRTSGTVSSQPRVTIINFTQPGLELKSVLNLEDNKEYNSEFFKWVKEKWNMEQVTNP
ncbi:DUF2806 domain-containing protein [Patescibacteria group bacterium]|nr:DUF2806 domain-containing protein [Patescibacteria group bacterium]